MTGIPWLKQPGCPAIFDRIGRASHTCGRCRETLRLWFLGLPRGSGLTCSGAAPDGDCLTLVSVRPTRTRFSGQLDSTGLRGSCGAPQSEGAQHFRAACRLTVDLAGLFLGGCWRHVRRPKTIPTRFVLQVPVTFEVEGSPFISFVQCLWPMSSPVQCSGSRLHLASC